MSQRYAVPRWAQDKILETVLTVAKITRRGVIAAALIGLLGAIVAAVINALSRQSEQKPGPSGNGTAQPAAGADR
jgi:hypothetical protein